MPRRTAPPRCTTSLRRTPPSSGSRFSKNIRTWSRSRSAGCKPNDRPNSIQKGTDAVALATVMASAVHGRRLRRSAQLRGRHAGGGGPRVPVPQGELRVKEVNDGLGIRVVGELPNIRGPCLPPRFGVAKDTECAQGPHGRTHRRHPHRQLDSHHGHRSAAGGDGHQCRSARRQDDHCQPVGGQPGRQRPADIC